MIPMSMNVVALSDGGGGVKRDSESTTINIDNLTSAIANWNSAVGSFSGTVPKASTCAGLTALQDAGLANGFPGSYDSMLDSLTTFLTSVTSTIENYCNAAYEADKSVEDEMPEEEPPEEEEEETTPTTEETPKDEEEEDKEEETPEEDGDKKDEPKDDGDKDKGKDKDKDKGKKPPGDSGPKLEDNLSLQANALSTMSLNDLSNISSLLSKLAAQNNVTVDELLGNGVYAQQIHSMLSNNSSLSEDYRNLIKAGKVDICQTSLKNLFSGKGSTQAMGIDTNTTKLMKTYLEDVAKKNNTTTEVLLSTSEGKKIVKSALKDFDGISDYASKYGSSGTDSLTDVYNSNDETKYKSIIKKFVDIAKGSDDVTVDQYSASSNTKDSINNLGKLSLFASNMSNYSDDGCASVLQSLFYS